jgi:hypothetical protein
MQKKKSTRALLGALALLASTAAWAGTEVRFDKPSNLRMCRWTSASARTC